MKKILIATALASAFSSYMALADDAAAPTTDTSGKFVLTKVWTNTVSFSKPMAVAGEVNTEGKGPGAYNTDQKDVNLVSGMLTSENGTVYVSAPSDALNYNTSDKSWFVGIPIIGVGGHPTRYEHQIKVGFTSVGESVAGRQIYTNVPSYPVSDTGLFFVQAKDLSNALPGANYTINVASAVWVNN